LIQVKEIEQPGLASGVCMSNPGARKNLFSICHPSNAKVGQILAVLGKFMEANPQNWN